MTERDEQAALFAWAELMSGQYPELMLMFAIPNGQMRRGMAPEPGLKSGVPDVFLPVPRRDYHGLFVEMKFGRNRLSAAQTEWAGRLRASGYKFAVCWSADGAIETICEYLEIKT